MRAGGDVDDPGGAGDLPLLLLLSGALEAGQQQVGEQDMALKEGAKMQSSLKVGADNESMTNDNGEWTYQMVDAKLRLVSVVGLGARPKHDAGVVDQDVDGHVLREDCASKLLH